MDDKGCYNQENHGSTSHNFEFQKANGTKLLASRYKMTPSKWDDAQKWIAGISAAGVGGGGGHGHHKNKHRNSNADDRRLLNSASQKGRESCSSVDLGFEEYITGPANVLEEGETKKIDCGDQAWRMSNPLEETAVDVRDVGTEMTPMASQEPSRTGTPIRATSPIESSSSSPGRHDSYQRCVRHSEGKSEGLNYGRGPTRGEGEVDSRKGAEVVVKTPSALESQARAWDEAERSKYMARYKRKELKIQAWENHEKRNAEMVMKRTEVKAERLKTRAEEKVVNKLASTRRKAEEKRATAEAKMNEQAARTSEKADYIRKTGHSPHSFGLSFKLPSICR